MSFGEKNKSSCGLPRPYVYLWMIKDALLDLLLFSVNVIGDTNQTIRLLLSYLGLS